MIAQNNPFPETALIPTPVRLQALELESLANLVTRVPGVPHRQFEVEAPFTGEKIGQLPACNETDVELAVKRARVAQPVWARRPVAERQAIFKRYHDLVLRRQAELLDVIQLESGKARQHALEEVFDVALTGRYYAYHAQRFLKTRSRRGLFPLVARVQEHHHPVGVAGFISPWNYPLTLAISDVIPALIAGNTAVLKPAELTPFTALLAVKLLREAGLPHEVFQVVTGQGSVIGPALIDRVDYVMFTGSTATGRVVAQQAAGRLIPCSMELGGKNAAIVLNDADINRAVEGVIRGTFSNAGQLCIAFERLYVQEGLYPRFLDRLVERVRALRLGATFDYNADIGSLISQGQLDTVHGQVQQALAQGARLLTGGRPRPDIGPYFYEPTVLAGVTETMTLCREETFGPVIAAYPFRTIREVIRRANDSAYGLNAGIWTRNLKLARKMAAQIKTGTVNINEGYAATWASLDAPMGGMKTSGIGRRHGREGILKYTTSQAVGSLHFLSLAPSRLLPAARFALVMTLILWLIRRIPGLR